MNQQFKWQAAASARHSAVFVVFVKPTLAFYPTGRGRPDAGSKRARIFFSSRMRSRICCLAKVAIRDRTARATGGSITQYCRYIATLATKENPPYDVAVFYAGSGVERLIRSRINFLCDVRRVLRNASANRSDKFIFCERRRGLANGWRMLWRPNAVFATRSMSEWSLAFPHLRFGLLNQQPASPRLLQKTGPACAGSRYRACG